MVSVSVVGVDGTTLLDAVTLEPDDCVQVLRAKVWMRTKDPNFSLITADGNMLSDTASLAESDIKDGAQITMVKSSPAEIPGKAIPEELVSFFEFLKDKKVDKRILDMWFLEDLAKMSQDQQDIVMDQFKLCESIDINGPTRSLPHEWDFSGVTPTGESVEYHLVCQLSET
eukprot:gnl/MRDRNA2_/MRDRNA2_119033_c0_seq1.p1 gnl/MRDRNA2_/MRDRNA2_119033_c0~~gnl/MRDRNA2_/MRDRNA2_119033_c0_seq1.p1  ORF type:complete len:171 (+),score=37.53 gnl/MRDRNA2_/MRDRNA2_119033_c0_seq1:95-607(+)